jgi:tRNA A-37 threonylcarbamoyl transferase component Bud32
MTDKQLTETKQLESQPELKVETENILLPSELLANEASNTLLPKIETKEEIAARIAEEEEEKQLAAFRAKAAAVIDQMQAVSMPAMWVGTAILIASVVILYIGANMQDPQLNNYAHNFIENNKIGNLDHLMGMAHLQHLLPLILVLCALTTVISYFLFAKARAREIDWSDSHLFLEYSGPLSYAIKWSAVESVEQVRRWDLFNGKQPNFIVKTKEGDSFNLKLTDIAHKHDVRSFFTLVKTNAPSAKITVDRAFASDNSYTELWLRYFSSPVGRAKTGQLEKGMRLVAGLYEIEHVIGGGGQGTTYLAKINPHLLDRKTTDQEDDHFERIITPNMEKLTSLEHVVLKEYVLPVHRGQLTAQKTAEKLKGEAEILMHLDHPHIVKLMDAFIEDYRGYLVLDYIPGESLKEMTESFGSLPEKTVIELAIQTCEILEYLHGLVPPVVHRDIAPDNLMLHEDGSIRIVDFNVAHQVDGSATATVVGKHSYISAEQFRGKPIPQSDIYSLGGTIHYLLTGQEPEPITRSHPRMLNPKVSEKLDEVVAKCTYQDASMRYKDASELKRALSAI